MAKTVIMASRIAAMTTSTTSPQYIAISGECKTSTFEDVYRTKLHYAGSLAKMGINIAANTLSAGAATLRLRKNQSTNMNQVISIDTGAVGYIEDVTYTDTITAGDFVYFALTLAGGETGTFTIASTKLEYDTSTSTTNTITVLRNSAVPSITAASTTYFRALTGGNDTPSTTEADQVFEMRYSATLRNMGVYMSVNDRTTATTVRLRKNTADGNQVISIPNQTVGYIEDVTHTDSVVENDQVCFSITTGTGTQTITFRGMQIDFQTTTDPAIGILALTNNLPTTTRHTEPLTRYLPLGGCIQANSNFTTESQSQTKLYEAYTFKGLTVSVRSNDISNSSTITFRKNGVSQSMVVSVPASTIGHIEDVTNTVTIASGDSVNYMLVTPAVSGTRYIGIANIIVYTEIAGTPTSTTATEIASKTLVNRFITKV